MPAPRFRRCSFLLIAACVALAAAPISAATPGPKLGSLLFVPSDVYNSGAPATQPSPAAKTAAATATEEARTAVATIEISENPPQARLPVPLPPDHPDLGHPQRPR